MTPTLPQLIAELKAIEAKATRGPWSQRTDLGDPWERDIYAMSPNVSITDPNGFKRVEDAAITVAARNFLPHLIAVVEKQAEEIAEHRACDNGSGAEASYSISWERLLAATDLATQSLLAAWQSTKEKA
jgi:hypothetical protein